MRYQDLDAWKGCHELVLATYRSTDAAFKVDRDLPGRLRSCALSAAGKVAFGVGSGSRRMLVRALHRVQGYLWSYASYLELIRVMGIVPDEVCVNLDALRGRAAFYTMRELQRTIRRKR